MTKDVIDLDNKKKDIIGFFVRIFIAIFVIVLVIVIYNSFFNNNVYVDLNDPDLVETKDGYKKVVDFETKVDKKEIKTLQGHITISIPPMTSSGQKLRLKELGLPKKGGGNGNLNARIKIVIPKNLTEKQKELFKQIQELS